MTKIVNFEETSNLTRRASVQSPSWPITSDATYRWRSDTNQTRTRPIMLARMNQCGIWLIRQLGVKNSVCSKIRETPRLIFNLSHRDFSRWVASWWQGCTSPSNPVLYGLSELHTAPPGEEWEKQNLKRKFQHDVGIFCNPKCMKTQNFSLWLQA